MTIRTLLADDHTLMRESVRRLLERQDDFTIVAQAADGRRAVELAAALSPDLAILDVTMPALNGIDVARHIKSQNARTCVVMLSMHAEHHLVEAALAAGVSAYVMKDAGIDDLLTAIGAARRGEIYLSPPAQRWLVTSCLGTATPAAPATPATPATPAAPAAGTTLGHHPAAALEGDERELLQLLAEGKTVKQIGLLMHRNFKTVDGQRRRIMRKLNVDNPADLTRYAIREGIIPA